MTARLTKWKRRLLITIAVLACYVLSYLALSRYSTGIVKGSEGEYFYYAPVTEDELVKSKGWQEFHYFCIWFYFPAWYVDHHVFNGPDCYLVPDRLEKCGTVTY